MANKFIRRWHMVIRRLHGHEQFVPDIKALVGALGEIMLDVLGDQVVQVLFAQHDEMVEALVLN